MTVRKRTRNSFLVSLIIHAIVFVSIGGIIPQLYIRSEPEPNPFPYQTTEVELYRTKALRPALRRTNVLKKTSSLSKRNVITSVAEQPMLALNQNSDLRSANSLHSIRQDLISTHAKLDESEKDLLSISRDSKDLFESIREPNTQVKTDAGSVKIDRAYSSPKNEEGEDSQDTQIGSALKNIAGEIVTSASDRKIDVVFLIDTSGSMFDNIHSVAENLSEMTSIFRESELDYALGVVKFKYAKLLPFPLTTDYTKYERLLMNVKCGGDERAYDAIVKSIRQVKFRLDSTRRFILITDEELKGSYNVIQTIGKLRAANITLDIIGLDTPLQKNLAKQTGGGWYPIPK